MNILVDTNVIMSGEELQPNHFVCSTVIEELEKHKHGFSDRARNSRKALRWALEHPENCVMSDSRGYSLNDDIIIETAKRTKCQLLTGDVAMFCKARIKGVDAVFFEQAEKIEVTYDGFNYDRHSSHAGKVWGLEAKNKEQQLLMNMLMDDSINLVHVISPAGTGKTLLSLAAGLELCSEGKFDKVLYLRKQSPVGQEEIGFLPGSKEEKLSPWVAAFYDNLEVILPSKAQREKILEEGVVEFESLGFMRGRSIANAFIIVDEAQNISVDEMKTILTRAGENTKIVLAGDIKQIDVKGLSEFNNGLSISSNLFIDWEKASSIVLTECVRSELASKAAELFEGI